MVWRVTSSGFFTTSLAVPALQERHLSFLCITSTAKLICFAKGKAGSYLGGEPGYVFPQKELMELNFFLMHSKAKGRICTTQELL